MPYAQRKPGVGRVRAFRDAIDDEFGHPDDELGFSWVPDAEERLGMPEPVHPDEGIETDVEPPKQPETVSDSRRRLEEAAAAHGKPFSFHENAEAELLVDLVKYDQAGVPAQRRPGRHSLHNAIRRNANKFPPP